MTDRPRPSLVSRLASRARAYELTRRLERVARFVNAPEREVRAWYREWERATNGANTLDLELYLIVRGLRPALVLETGVNRGHSSAATLRAMYDGAFAGRLVSIDLPTHDPRGRTNSDGRHDGAFVPSGMTGCEVPAYLRGPWTLTLGDAREELARCARAGMRPDLFFHDSDHSYAHQRFEYEWAIANLAPGGVLASDDTNWTSAYRDVVLPRALASLTWSPSTPQRGAARIAGRDLARFATASAEASYSPL